VSLWWGTPSPFPSFCPAFLAAPPFPRHCFQHNYMHAMRECVRVGAWEWVRVCEPYFRLMMASTRIRQMKKSTSTCGRGARWAHPVGIVRTRRIPRIRNLRSWRFLHFFRPSCAVFAVLPQQICHNNKCISLCWFKWAPHTYPSIASYCPYTWPQHYDPQQNPDQPTQNSPSNVCYTRIAGLELLESRMQVGT